MSVVGYDFGNFNSVISVARHGGIDVLCNDFSLRATPSCVAFGRKSRLMGVAGRQQVNTNAQNTVINFKHLLGRSFSHPVTQLYKKFIPCEMVQTDNDGIGFKVNFLGDVKVLSPEQIAAAFLVKLKQITEHELGTKIKECMISVPSYFSDVQATALKAAGQIAGLNVLDLVKENEATGIAYGLYKNASLPAEPSKLVVIVDVGHASAQASLMMFSNKTVEVLCSSYDIELGGLFFDDVIRKHFKEQFFDRFKVDATKNAKAWLRLLDESEKVKKQMSVSTMNIPLNIECFMNDTDVSGTISRGEFEELAKPLFQKFNELIGKLLMNVEKIGIKKDDISEVEFVGGSSRIPALKQIIRENFNMEPRSTIDVDESVARGVAMQCAIVFPTTKVKDFSVIHKQEVTGSNEKSSFCLAVEDFIKIEHGMQAADLSEKRKANAKNDLEEYCYDMSDKLSGSTYEFISQEENNKFREMINQATDWLNNDGEDALHMEYASKLSSLRSSIDSVIQQNEDELEKKRRKIEEKSEEKKKEKSEEASKETISKEEVIKPTAGCDE